MKKLKVAFFAEILIKDFDGASRTMFQIIERIPTDRFEFCFICGVKPDKDIGHDVLELPTLPIPFNASYKMAIPYFSEHQVKRKLESFKPDIIHIASPSPLGFFALDFAIQNSIPTVSIYHTHFLSYIDYYLRHLPVLISGVKALVSKKQKQFYDQCNKVLVPTLAMKSELASFGFKTNHMSLWQRGLDKKLFTPEKRDKAFVEKIVKNKKPNVLFASRLVWEKNLKTLIEIYKKNLQSDRPFNLIIAGDGVASQSLNTTMPKAHFVGKVSHSVLSKLYASCDAFVFTSISETYGNVVVEAMASGLPCVIADGGGSASFIRNNINGFKVSPNESDQYLSTINKLLSNKELKDRIISNGLEYVKDLDWDNLTNKYFDLIQMLSGTSVQKELV